MLFCKDCHLIHRCSKKTKNLNCYKCGQNVYENSFYYSPFLEYLKYRAKDPKFRKDLLYYKDFLDPNSKNGALRDIFDGFTFQNLKNKYFPDDNKNNPKKINLALIYNTDGVSVNKKSSIWPFFLSISNVSRENRKNLDYNHMFAICGNPKKNSFFRQSNSCWFRN